MCFFFLSPWQHSLKAEIILHIFLAWMKAPHRFFCSHTTVFPNYTYFINSFFQSTGSLHKAEGSLDGLKGYIIVTNNSCLRNGCCVGGWCKFSYFIAHYYCTFWCATLQVKQKLRTCNDHLRFLFLKSFSPWVSEACPEMKLLSSSFSSLERLTENASHPGFVFSSKIPFQDSCWSIGLIKCLRLLFTMDLEENSKVGTILEAQNPGSILATR